MTQIAHTTAATRLSDRAFFPWMISFAVTAICGAVFWLTIAYLN